MRGFAEAKSDGIVQITVGGARYPSGVADDGYAAVWPAGVKVRSRSWATVSASRALDR